MLCLALAISPPPEPITEFSQASTPPRRPTRRVTSQPPADSGSSAPSQSSEPEPESETLLRPRRVKISQFFCAKDKK